MLSRFLSLGAHMKDLVYQEKTRTIQKLKAQVTSKFGEVGMELFK